LTKILSPGHGSSVCALTATQFEKDTLASLGFHSRLLFQCIRKPLPYCIGYCSASVTADERAGARGALLSFDFYFALQIASADLVLDKERPRPKQCRDWFPVTCEELEVCVPS